MFVKEFRPRVCVLVGIGGIFLLVDQLLKFFARSNPDFEYYIAGKWLGWEYMANSGIAFSLPFPNWLLVLITPLIIFGLIIWAIKRVPCNIEHEKWKMEHVSFALIIFGALSNFIDRVLFSATIDYLRILTGVINVADVMIVAGAMMVVFGELRAAKFNKKKQNL
ncbi:MAG: signal peptidase II [Candidatus Magasanikbacteria bacterium]|nr:signal peptidase II [Candidatus Magasanikbacteria bacterium]